MFIVIEVHERAEDNRHPADHSKRAYDNKENIVGLRCAIETDKDYHGDNE